MEFNVFERMVLLALLPKEGNFTNLKLIRMAKEDLSFTEEENTLLNFRFEGETVHWVEGVVAPKEIDLGETVTNMIIKQLKDLDSKEKLTNEHFSLYEKFIK